MKYLIIALVACALFSSLVAAAGRGGRKRNGREGNSPLRCEDGSRPVKRCSDGTEKERRTPCSDGVPPQRACADGSAPVSVVLPGRCADNTKPSCPNNERPQRRCTDGSRKLKRNQCADRQAPAKRCSTGDLPTCTDGSTPSPRH